MRTTLFHTTMVGILSIPFLAYAQVSTTTADQPIDPNFQIHQDILKITQDQIDSAPTVEEIGARALVDNLEIRTLPATPGPNELVKVSIQSYLTDLNKAYISWKLNGKTVSGGTGEKTFSFQNGYSGETTSLSVTITTSEGEIVTKDLSWTPVGVTLFWHANTYTPPFYKGKPLASPQSLITVVATPDNMGAKNALSAGNLVYTWSEKGTVSANSSGYGRNSFSFTLPRPYVNTNISVRVSSIDDSLNSSKEFNLSPSNPFVLFYENSPLMGVQYNRALGLSTNLTGKEISLSAEPYFFSGDVSAQDFKYSWAVNGIKSQNVGRLITLRNDKGAAGSSDVTLGINGIKKTFQNASQELRINFSVNNSAKPIF